MTGLGYAPTEWQFIMEAYPNLTANPATNASALNIFRPGDSGCLFYSSDANYFNTRGAPMIGDAILHGALDATAAGIANVSVLHLRDAFLGRERCRLAREMSGTAVNGVPRVSSDWSIGDPLWALVQESMHPNPLGAGIVGTCMSLMLVRSPGAGNQLCTRGSLQAQAVAPPVAPFT